MFLSLPSAAQEESSAARLNNSMECTFIFIFCLLSLKQKKRLKGEQMGKKMLKPEKEDRKKGKCILNNFINEVKKDLFRQLFIQNSCFYQ